jgi:pimeloyl-ACP methyl ester carboxylesterase
MPTFDSNGVAINYVDEGSGRPVVLVHGFAANLELNWRAPGVIDALLAAGRRVIALDCRGHGKSGKPRDPAAYAGTAMADDVVALADHLRLERPDLAGYSMGGQIAATLLVKHPDRWNSVILSGVGDWVLGESGGDEWHSLVAGLEAKDARAITDPAMKAFRMFIEASGNDVAALAAQQRAGRTIILRDDLARVKLPVMVLLGENDTLIGTGDNLVAAIPGAKLVTAPGDHMTVVGQPEFRQAIVEFLAAHSPIPAR